MIIRAIDENGDWTFGKGIQNYKTELDAIKENILTRVKEWKGDCFFSLQSGVDYNSYLDVGTKKYLDSDLIRVILQSFGVLRVDSYESKLTLRGLVFSANIATIYGKILLNEVT
jgi:hypothetical protein